MAAPADWLMLFSAQLVVPIVVAAIGEAWIAMPAALRLTCWRAVLCGSLLLAAPSAPVYTQAAMEAGIEGDVWLTAVLRPDGTVDQVDIVDSLDAELGLDASAVEAAGQWRFEPGTVDGEPVAVRVTLEFRFALD